MIKTNPPSQLTNFLMEFKQFTFFLENLEKSNFIIKKYITILICLLFQNKIRVKKESTMSTLDYFFTIIVIFIVAAAVIMTIAARAGHRRTARNIGIAGAVIIIIAFCGMNYFITSM